MRIYTYYAPLQTIKPADEMALIELWKWNWKRNGFDPVVLGVYEAQRSPIYKAFRDAILKFPTPNPAGYDEACWLRWLAYAGLGDDMVLASDYDCMGYGFEPFGTDTARINMFAGWVPCFVMARPEIIFEMCNMMMSSTPDKWDEFQGHQIYEDQHWFCHAMKELPALFNPIPAVKEFTEPGWEKALVVHYNNHNMPAFRPRFQHIPKLRRML
jgi:hypothetical protein